MVPERSRPLAPEQACEPDLAAGGRQQVFAADHEVDPLSVVVDGDGELIRPVAEPIADHDVAALLRRILFLGAEDFVDEPLDTGVHPYTPSDAVSERQSAIATLSGIPQLRCVARLAPPAFAKAAAGSRASRLDLFPRAITGIDEPLRGQYVDRFSIDRLALALSDDGEVGPVAEPIEIVEDAHFVLRTAALAIVVFDSQENFSA
jgi:hypothetical protein